MTTLEGAHQIRILPNRAIHHPTFLLGHTQPQHHRALAHQRLLLTSAGALSDTKRRFDRMLRALCGAMDVDELGGSRTEGVLRESEFVAGAP